MFRILITGLLFLTLACGNEQSRLKTRKSIASDTVPQQLSESFDLRVKKYEDPKRQNWQDPKLVIEALGSLEGKTIADIGSGTGYFTFQLAVPAKKVIAIDIEQRFLNYIEDRKTEMHDKNLAAKIETRFTQPDNPKLTENEVDIVLIVNTISYISYRENYLAKVLQGLSPGGIAVVVDYRLGAMPVGPDEQLKVNPQQVVRELRTAGFSIDKVDVESLQYQYLIKASKP